MGDSKRAAQEVFWGGFKARKYKQRTTGSSEKSSASSAQAVSKRPWANLGFQSLVVFALLDTSHHESCRAAEELGCSWVSGQVKSVGIEETTLPAWEGEARPYTGS